MELEPEKPVEVRTTHLEDAALEDELAESHFSKLHWARATTETPVRVGDVQEPVVALIDHGSEINLMSMDFYKKGKWPINTKHSWKIRAATRAMEELHRGVPERARKDQRRRDRSTLLCAGDVFAPSDTRRAIHHSNMHGNKGARLRLGIRTREESRQTTLRPISDRKTKS